MIHQGKNKLFVSIGLTVLLIIMSLVLFIFKAEARGALIILSPMVIIMAFISVYVSFIQVERIEERIDSLPKSYQSVYFDAHELVGTYGMLKRDKEEIMYMIIEIFEHASLEDREVDEVVGNNLSKFVEGFIAETGKKYNSLYLFSYATFLFIGYLLLIKAYKVLRTGHITVDTLKSETMDLGLVLTYCIIAYIVVPWLLLSIKRSTIYHWNGVKRILVIIPLLIPIGLFMGLILINDPELIKIIEYPVPLFSSIWSIGIGILLLIGSLLLVRLQKRP